MALSSLNIRLILNDKEFQSGLKRAQKRLKKFSRQMDRAGQNMTRNFTAPIAALGVVSVKVFADFEQQMANVKAVSGATNKEFGELEETAKRLGRTTKFTASQVAGLELNYSKLGFSADEINVIAESTLQLAQATGEDLAASATVAGATLRGFGMDATEMQVVVDVMAKSFSSSALDLQKFKISMAKVAPVAKNAGLSIQETTAMTSILADRGIEASTVGTSMRNIFLSIAEKGITLKEALDKIKNSSNQNATAMAMFGREGATAAIMLANNQAETAKLTETYFGAAGAAKKMAGIMDDTLMGSLHQLRSALEGAGIEIGEVLKPLIEKLIEKIKKLAAWFTGLSDGTQKTILVIVGLVAAIGPLLIVIGKMATGVSALIGVVKKLDTAFLTNPYLLAAAALITLSIAVYKVVKSKKELNVNVGEFTKKLGEEKFALDDAFDALKNTKIGTDERSDAIKKVNEKYGEYLPNLLSEKSTLQEINIAQDAANKSLMRKTAIMQKQNEIQEANIELLDETSDFAEELSKQVKKVAGTKVAGKVVKEFLELNKTTGDATQAFKMLKDKLGDYDIKAKHVEKVSRKVNKELIDLSDAQEKHGKTIKDVNLFYDAQINKSEGFSDAQKKEIEQLENKIEARKKSRKDYEKGEKLYKLSTGVIEKLTNQLEKLKLEAYNLQGASIEKLLTLEKSREKWLVKAAKAEIKRREKLKKGEEEDGDGAGDGIEDKILAYDALKNKLSDIKTEIENLVAAGSPIPDKLIADAKEASEELEKVEKAIADINERIEGGGPEIVTATAKGITTGEDADSEDKGIGFKGKETDFGIGPQRATDVFKEAYEEYLKKLAKAEAATEAFTESIKELISTALNDAFVTIGESIGNLISGKGGFGAALLTMIADFAAQLGKLIIGVGVAKLAFIENLKNLSPASAPIMIAAGVALVAAATFVRNKISKGMDAFAAGGFSTGGLAMVGERGPELVNLPAGAHVNTATRSKMMMDNGGELTTRIAGRDLEIILNRTKAQSARR